MSTRSVGEQPAGQMWNALGRGGASSMGSDLTWGTSWCEPKRAEGRFNSVERLGAGEGRLWARAQIPEEPVQGRCEKALEHLGE